MSNIKMFCIFIVAFVTGLTMVPQFCPMHQTKDYCWIEESIPHGGNGEILG